MISFDSEKIFEDYLLYHSEFFRETWGLHDAGIYRQMRLGKYGIADIVCAETLPSEATGGIPELQVTIFELKNTVLSASHIAQICRYREFFVAAENYLEGACMSVTGVLIGKKTLPTGDGLCYLCQAIPWLDVYEFSLEPDEGLIFNLISGWRPSDIQSGDYVDALNNIYQQPIKTAKDGAA